MMESVTPKSKSQRIPHTPTSKMSERKKGLLFSNTKTNIPSIIDEESDLGPISLLDFSSDSDTTDENNVICSDNDDERQNSLRKNFENILQLSPPSLIYRSLSSSLSSLDLNDATNDNEPKELAPQFQTTVDYKKDNILTKNINYANIGNKSIELKLQNKLIANNPVRPLRMMPSINKKSLRCSKNNDRTPDSIESDETVTASIYDVNKKSIESSISRSTVKKCHKIKESSDSKAKTSLLFAQNDDVDEKINKLPVISVRTFYGPTKSPSELYELKKRRELNLSLFRNNLNTKTLKRNNSKRYSNGKNNNNKSKKYKKIQFGTINKGVHHNIRKPIIKRNKQVSKLITFADNQKKNLEFNVNRDSCPSSIKSTEKQIANKDYNTKFTREQIERLRKIILNSINPIDMVKPVKIGNAKTNAETVNDNANNLELGTSSIINEPDDINKKNKFFKSHRSENRGDYHIIGNITATVKRGSNLKLHSLPKKKKVADAKYDEFECIRVEVADIIKILDIENSSNQKIGKENDNQNSIQQNINVLPEIPVTTAANNQHDLQVLLEQDVENVNQSNIRIEGEMKIVADNNKESPVVISVDEKESENCDTNDNIERFTNKLPYNTNDPEMIQRQFNVLNFLIANDICTERNFKIFIVEPELHQEEAHSILNELCVFEMDYDESVVDNIILMDNQKYDYTNNDIIIINAEMSQLEQQQQQQQQQQQGQEQHEEAVAENQMSDNYSMANILNKDVAMTSATRHIQRQEDESPLKLHIDQPPTKLFPIFNKSSTTLNSQQPQPENRVGKLNIKNDTFKKWIPNGRNQLQIDAGQKAFGSTTCPQCSMTYTVHEPEEELIHANFHDSFKYLKFKGWLLETIVKKIPAWGIEGRIICVTEKSPKSHRTRLTEILQMIDNDLGISNNSSLAQGSIIYLAISKQQIIGVGVAHPLQKANRAIQKNGIDCYSEEIYPVKCGISRIWVSPLYRRHGIASHLFTAIRSHYIFGYYLGLDEIAFSAPTEMGKLLAEKLYNRSDFLTYDLISL